MSISAGKSDRMRKIVLLRMRNDAENTINRTDDSKIKTIAQIHTTLPYVIVLIVFLCMNRRVTDVATQKLQLFESGFAESDRQFFEVFGRVDCKRNVHFLPMNLL